MIYILIIFILLLVETMIKSYFDSNWEEGKKKPILKGKIILNKRYNKGMMLNFMEDKKDLVKKVTSIAVGLILLVFLFFLPKKNMRLEKLALSLCLAGGISNLSDRFIRGQVVDYFTINFRRLKRVVFNLADIFIFLGAIILLVASIFKGDKLD